MANVKVNADGTVTIGTADGDVLVALTDEDTVLIGGAGDDALTGGGGNDKLVGGGGNDTLSGEGGLDLLIGGKDDDILNGGADDDVLIGGSGFDTYLFGENSGVDAIMGFNTAEDTIDLSGAGISDLTGRVTDDANGNAVIDLGDGNQVTVVGVSSADLLANGDFVLAPSGPEEIFLGIDGTYTDAGDGTDQIIDGDSNGEALTDTDLFIFGPNNGHDTITDFQKEDFDFTVGAVAGDSLDLRAYGITDVGDLDTAGAGVFDVNAVSQFHNLVGIQYLDSSGTIIGEVETLSDGTVQFVGTKIGAVDSRLLFSSDDDVVGGNDVTAEDSLTLLGVNDADLEIILEQNTVNTDGTTGGAV